MIKEDFVCRSVFTNPRLVFEMAISEQSFELLGLLHAVTLASQGAMVLTYNDKVIVSATPTHIVFDDETELAYAKVDTDKLMMHLPQPPQEAAPEVEAPKVEEEQPKVEEPPVAEKPKPRKRSTTRKVVPVKDK